VDDSVTAELRPPAEASSHRVPAWVGSAAGLVGIVVLWQIAGATIFAKGRAVPTPTAILNQMGKDGWSFYSPNIRATVTEALKGWVWGNLLAMLSGVTFAVKSAARRAGLGLVHAHRLRHTAASEMLRCGATLPEVGQVLRHRHTATTAIYALGAAAPNAY